MRYQGRFSGQKPSGKKGGTGRKILIGMISVLLVLVITVFGASALYIRNKAVLIHVAKPMENTNTDLEGPQGWFSDEEEVDSFDPEELIHPEEDVGYGKSGKLINILLIGQDSRKGEESKLADSIILCTLNKEKKTLTLTSFLRDMFLKMPDYKGHLCGKNRINVNYALGYAWGGDLGAMEMLDLCIYNNFGVEIDGNIEVGFEAFEDVVNYLGGVDVVMNSDEARYMSNLDYLYEKDYAANGKEHLDGWETLAYVRMRHSSNADNDFRRTERQRTVIGQMMDKMRNLNALEMDEIINMVLPMVMTDLDSDTLLTYVKECLPLLPQLKLETGQCPAEETFYGDMIDIYGDGNLASVLIPDVASNRKILLELCEGIILE